MKDIVRVGLISDTHGTASAAALAALSGVDRILHAGDVGAADVLDNRQRVLTAAFQQHPERFVRKPPRPAPLPDAVWINPPKPATATEPNLH